MTVDFAIEPHLQELDAQGYSVIRGFLDRPAVEEARAHVVPHLRRYGGRNAFEGLHTERVYTTVARGGVFERIIEDPRIMALAGRLLAGDVLLSVAQAINLLPGEKAQPLHHDSGDYPLPRSFAPVSFTTLIALDPFTDENGATEVVPGSHRWDDATALRLKLAKRAGANLDAFLGDLVKVFMAPGDCLVFAGNFFHRAGANCSGASRLALTNQYCEAWVRPIETFLLSVPRERVRHMSPRLKRLLGYEMVPPIMGSLSREHPLSALDPDFVEPVVRDDAALRQDASPRKTGAQSAASAG